MVSEELGYVTARTSGLLLSDQTVEAVLGLLTATAMHVVPNASGSGITLVAPDGSRTTAAGTDRVVERADLLQYDMDEGPCLDAWLQRRVIQVDDLTVDPRWPRWAPAAAEMGLRSALSTSLVVGERSVGALKLYATQPHVFTDGDRATASMFAAQAAILVSSAQTFRHAGQFSEELQGLLRERDTIARATGLVMGRQNVPEDRAFSYLMSRAQGEGGGVYQAATKLLGSVRQDR